ncbi:MAG: 2-(1,2-epoxy-1,2-dihydrophenyl)acetyl-CoA isomerase [Deltaproteobacteria bacterium]|jgi:2-(1,2-epoxy-1,2-dihydrophenyl)acetyl-CoA isomerase|nr:2-(1,2-epoxy-1,2-dihydrophenyl)acetyl-CoA isomerase [Deltaproteobacteria bacterium]
MSELLSLERDERGVYTLTIRRPEVRNALNEQAFHELISICGRVAADDDARVLVLTGEGRAFSAGGDFESLQRMLDGDRAYAVAELENAGAGVSALARLEIPTVAALNGDAFGGGAAVALSTDYRVMSDAARLGFVFSRLGISGADTGASWWLARIVGPSRALEILSLGRVFGAAEAQAEGLVTEVAPAETFDDSVSSFVDRLASLAPLALRGNKRALRSLEARSLDIHLALEAQIQADCIRSADFREGLDAFQNKRRPVFKGS